MLRFLNCTTGTNRRSNDKFERGMILTVGDTKMHIREVEVDVLKSFD